MRSAPSSVPTDDEEKLAPGRIVATIVFAALAIVFFLAAYIYFTTPAHSLPGFMGFARTRAIHRLYAVGTFMAGRCSRSPRGSRCATGRWPWRRHARPRGSRDRRGQARDCP